MGARKLQSNHRSWQILIHLSRMQVKINITLNMKKHLVGCPWFTPVILATWEAEIGRITV
jgi:hypothetical protein